MVVRSVDDRYFFRDPGCPLVRPNWCLLIEAQVRIRYQSVTVGHLTGRSQLSLHTNNVITHSSCTDHPAWTRWTVVIKWCGHVAWTCRRYSGSMSAESRTIKYRIPPGKTIIQMGIGRTSFAGVQFVWSLIDPTQVWQPKLFLKDCFY
jgi:hypothetical protein